MKKQGLMLLRVLSALTVVFLGVICLLGAEPEQLPTWLRIQGILAATVLGLSMPLPLDYLTRRA